MKVRLLRDARILHKAGETVEVSPAEFQFLTSLGGAVAIPETAAGKAQEKATNTTTKSKTTK